MISQVHEASFFYSNPRTRRLSVGRKLDRCQTVVRAHAFQSLTVLCNSSTHLLCARKPSSIGRGMRSNLYRATMPETRQ
jgi:hypothetical protein